MRVPNKIIVHAEDFGYSDAVNNAVLRAFQRFLVTGASLIVNMPGFDNAMEMIHAQPSLRNKIGVRLNLSEGISLTPAIRSCKRLCHISGFFMLNSRRRILRLTKRERIAVYDEMKVQLEKALMAGVHPTHLDMHHSLHTQWPMADLMARLGEEYGIRRMRFFRSVGAHKHGVKIIRKPWLQQLTWDLSAISTPDFSGHLDDLLRLPPRKWPEGKFIEIAVHPVVDEYGELADRSGKGLQTRLRPIIDHRHTITYNELPLHQPAKRVATAAAGRAWSDAAGVSHPSRSATA